MVIETSRPNAIIPYVGTTLTLQGCPRCLLRALCHRCRPLHGGDSHCLTCGHVGTTLPEDVRLEVAESRGKRWLKWQTEMKMEGEG